MTGGGGCEVCKHIRGFLVVSAAVFVSRKTAPLVLKTTSQEKHGAFTERKWVLKEAELAGVLEEMKMTTVRVTNTQGWNVGSRSMQLPRLNLWRKF